VIFAERHFDDSRLLQDSERLVDAAVCGREVCGEEFVVAVVSPDEQTVAVSSCAIYL